MSIVIRKYFSGKNFLMFIIMFIIVMIVTTICTFVNAINLCGMGLIWNILGSIIVVFYGFPRRDMRSECVVELELGTKLGDGTTVRDLEDRAEVEELWGLLCSIFGVFCLVAGFVFQLGDQILSSRVVVIVN